MVLLWGAIVFVGDDGGLVVMMDPVRDWQLKRLMVIKLGRRNLNLRELWIGGLPSGV